MNNLLSNFCTDCLRPGSFLRSLATLGSGTAIAQIIPILASPIVTRLYSPQDFAMLAIFMSIVATFTPVICGKYEVALVLPKNQAHADHLLGIALYFSFAISGILAIMIAIAGDDFLLFLKADKLGGWLYFIPLALLLTGVFTAVNYYSNRNKDYAIMSRVRVTRTLTTTVTNIACGILGTHFFGLLTAFHCGIVFSTGYLLFHYRNLLNLQILRWNKKKRWLLQQYRHYPLYNATSSLLDGLTLSLPIFFMSRYFPDSVVGYYSLIIRVALTPVTFISVSVSYINLKKIVDLVNNRQSLVPYLLTLTALLALIIMIPSIIIIAWGPELFSLVFGSSWVAAGEYARILMPGIAIQFIVSILSSTLDATSNNRLGALWKVTSFILTFSVLAWFSPIGNIKILLYAFTAANIMLYLFYYAIILYAAQNPRNL